MRTVHKYTLRIAHGIQTVMMSDGARVVHVEMQGPHPTMWAEVLTTIPDVPRRYVVLATGQEVPDGAVHIGTFLDGGFVGHVYQVIP